MKNFMSSVTRKNFEETARIIRKSAYELAMTLENERLVTNHRLVPPYVKEVLCENLADYFERENSLFDRERFMKACK